MNRLLAVVSVLAAALAAPGVGFAQTVVRGGTVHPVGSEPIEGGVVVIGADGRIDAVGGSDTSTPEGATVIDASDKTVTPGFVDANTHLGLVEIWAVDDTRDDDRGGSDPIRAAFRTADGFNPASAAIPIARTGGVTSVVSVPNGGIVSGQSAWVDLGGSGYGQASVVETYAAQHVQFIGLDGGGDGMAGLKSRAGLMEKLRELYDDVAYYRDNREAFNQNDTREFVASRLDLEALVETLERNHPVAFEADRASDIVEVLDFAGEIGVDPVVMGGAEAWKVRERLASQNVPVVVQSTDNLPASFAKLGARTDNAALLADAGVPVALSTFGTHNVRRLKQMGGNAIRAGMTRDEALRAVTLHPARAFGMESDYGSLASGKVGNVVVWSGDPFEMSTHVDRMVIRGREVSLETRQIRLFERYRNIDRRGEPAKERAQ